MIRKDIQLYKAIILLENLKDFSLRKGLIGIVIYIYEESRLFEVEFATEEGEILEIVTLEAHQIEPIDQDKLKTLKKITFLSCEI